MNRNDIDSLNYDNPDEVALLCSYLCTIAYFDKDKQEKWIAERFEFDYYNSCVDTLQFFTMFDHTNKKAYFVVRGTDIKRFKDEWRDLRVSLRFWGKDIKNTKGHNGYIRAGNNLLAVMTEKVHEANDKGYDIIFTGHSLGGVLSKYIACMLNIPSSVYTFGAPCLAKSKFYDDVDKVSVYKYRTKDDLIPMFPSLLFDDIYGDEFLLDRGSITVDTEDKKGLLTPLLFLTKIKLFYKIFNAVKSHNITVYNLNLLRKYKHNKTKE